MIVVNKNAVVHPSTQLGEEVEIGEYSVIGENAIIGDRTKIYPGVIIEGWTTIGKNCKIYPGTIIGLEPQDLKYNGERSEVIIGDNNIIREHVTINSASEGGITFIGNDNYLMAYAHIAHNCRIGNRTIISNACSLAGYVEVGDQVVIGGMAGIHQFVRIGKLAMIGGYSKNIKDVPPFIKVDGLPAKVYGLNTVGLRRSNISLERRQELKRAYKLLYCSGLNLTQAIYEIETKLNRTEEVEELLKFLKAPSRMGVLI